MNILRYKFLTFNLIFLIFCLNTTSAFASPVPLRDVTQTVNAVIGDQSFISTFGHLPKVLTNSHLRIQTHLNYVIKNLKQHTPTRVSPVDYPQRHLMIALLENYATAGQFPQQPEYTGRRPLFEDSHGNVCAVGYLVQQTAGQKLVSQIRDQWAYDYLSEMKSKELKRWAKHSGLTSRELAMIQPTYEGGVGVGSGEQPPVASSIATVIQNYLFYAHLIAYIIPSENYEPFQLLDRVLTFGSIGIGTAAAIYEVNTKGTNLLLTASIVLLGALFSGLNLWLLDKLDEKLELHNQNTLANSLRWGAIPVAYGQATGISYKINF